MAKQEQLSLPINRGPNGHGGMRKSSGRKERDKGMPHIERSRTNKSNPRFITLKRAPDLGIFRVPQTRDLIIDCFRKAQRDDFRIIHFTIQVDHIHLIIESSDEYSLACGMKGLVPRITKNVNRLWGRSGQLFPERYHDRVLSSPTQIRNTLRYLFNNWRKHSVDTRAVFDDCSSAAYFDGWAGYAQQKSPSDHNSPVAEPGFQIGVLVKRHCSPISPLTAPVPMPRPRKPRRRPSSKRADSAQSRS